MLVGGARVERKGVRERRGGCTVVGRLTEGVCVRRVYGQPFGGKRRDTDTRRMHGRRGDEALSVREGGWRRKGRGNRGR